MPRILQSADFLFASSFDYIKSSEASFLFKQNPEKWIELPFGVDLEKFKPRKKPEASFTRLNLNAELPTLIFVGGMDAAHYVKGISVMLKALQMVSHGKMLLMIFSRLLTLLLNRRVGSGLLKDYIHLLK